MATSVMNIASFMSFSSLFLMFTLVIFSQFFILSQNPPLFTPFHLLTISQKTENMYYLVL